MIRPTQKKLLIVIAALLLAVVLLSFRLYMAQGSKPRPKPGRPAAWGVATVVPDRVILTLSDNPATTQSVTWRTDTTVKQAFAQIALADAAPRFGRDAAQLTAQTSVLDARDVESSGAIAHYHAVTFTGLLSDTTYAYRVGDGTHWSEWFQFRTASQEAKPFTFLYVGDAQNYILENYARVLRAAYQQAPQARLIIHSGDLVHTAHSEQQWHEWFTAGSWLIAQLPNLPAPGNHEYAGYTQNEHKAKKRHFSVQWPHQFTLPQNGPEGLKEAAYFMDYQGVRFITLNSNEKLEEQAVWLERVLQENKQPWTVVTFHHPVFSAANHEDNKAIRTLWQPLLEKYGVDLVLTGHEHTYTRGQALINQKPDGPVYVVSVSGGNMYYFKEKPWQDYKAQLQRKGENTQLFQVISVDGGQLQFKAYTASGALYDAFNLVKGSGEKGSRLQEVTTGRVAERNHQNTIPYKVKK